MTMHILNGGAWKKVSRPPKILNQGIISQPKKGWIMKNGLWQRVWEPDPIRGQLVYDADVYVVNGVLNLNMNFKTGARWASIPPGSDREVGQLASYPCTTLVKDIEEYTSFGYSIGGEGLLHSTGEYIDNSNGVYAKCEYYSSGGSDGYSSTTRFYVYDPAYTYKVGMTVGTTNGWGNYTTARVVGRAGYLPPGYNRGYGRPTSIQVGYFSYPSASNGWVGSVLCHYKSTPRSVQVYLYAT